MKRILSLLVTLPLFAEAKCYVFEDLEGVEPLKKVELCYEGGDFNSRLVSFEVTYPDGHKAGKGDGFEMRIEGSEASENLIHGVDSQNYWFMVEWHMEGITAFDERANEGAFLDLVESSH